MKTVTGTVPAAAISVAGIVAVSCVLLPNVVERSAPLHRTTDAAMKFVPVSVSVKAGPPTVALDGAIELNVGAGFAVIVNV